MTKPVTHLSLNEFIKSELSDLLSGVECPGEPKDLQKAIDVRVDSSYLLYMEQVREAVSTRNVGLLIKGQYKIPVSVCCPQCTLRKDPDCDLCGGTSDELGLYQVNQPIALEQIMRIANDTITYGVAAGVLAIKEQNNDL
ncbi:hypothetical protein ABV540_003779 [Vibrio fluvialis]